MSSDKRQHWFLGGLTLVTTMISACHPAGVVAKPPGQSSGPAASSAPGPTSSTPAATATPAPKPPPPPENHPFVVAARFGPGVKASLKPTDGGLYALWRDGAGPLQIVFLPRVGDTAVPVPTHGLPQITSFDAIAGIDGRWPERAWLAYEQPDGSCVAFQGKSDRWVAVGKPLPSGCDGIRSWTTGAAITFTDTDQRFYRMHFFGTTPAVVPQLAPGSGGTCPYHLSAVTSYSAFESGEVVALGYACSGGMSVTHWAKGSGDAVTQHIWGLEVGKYFMAMFPTPNRVLLLGNADRPADEDKPATLLSMRREGDVLTERPADEPVPPGLHNVHALAFGYGPEGLDRDAAADAEGFKYVSAFGGTAGELYVEGEATNPSGPTGATVYLVNRPVSTVFSPTR